MVPRFDHLNQFRLGLVSELNRGALPGLPSEGNPVTIVSGATFLGN